MEIEILNYSSTVMFRGTPCISPSVQFLYHMICRNIIIQGIGGTRLEPREDRIRKSISNETTFKETSDRNILIGRTLIPFPII